MVGGRKRWTGRVLRAAANVARSPVVGEGVKRLLLSRLGGDRLWAVELGLREARLPTAAVAASRPERGAPSAPPDELSS